MVSFAGAFGHEWTIGGYYLDLRLTTLRPSSVCTATVLVWTICEAVAACVMCCLSVCVRACMYSLHDEIWMKFASHE